MSSILNPVTRTPFGLVGALVAGAVFAAPGQQVNVKAAGAAVTVKAPAPAVQAMVFAVLDADGSAGATPIVLDGNGANIDGSATSAISVANDCAVLIFDAGSWRRIIATRAVDGTNAAVIEYEGAILAAVAGASVGVVGLGVVPMLDADKTPGLAITNLATIQTTGLLTADRNLVVPAAVDGVARIWDIDNACTGSFGIVVTTGAGVTAHVVNGSKTRVRSCTAGVVLLEPGIVPGAGQDSMRWGVDSAAAGPLAIAFGKGCSAPGAGAFVAGEGSTSGGANASSVGFNNTVSAVYGAALGVNIGVSGTGATGLGVNTNAARAGELAHNGGHANVQGMHAVDMFRTVPAGATLNLFDPDGLPFILDNTSFVSMHVRIVVAQITGGGTVFACETHELVVSAPVAGPNAVLVSDATISGAGALLAAGYVLTISCPGGSNELRFAAHNTNAADARFLARCTFTQIGNLLA